MNMIYHKGQFVGYVDVGNARLEVPVPRRWYIRKCTPGKDAVVVERLRMLDVGAWSPTLVRFIDRRTGKVAAKPHLGKRVEKPFLPGMIFIPDCELDRGGQLAVDDLGDFLQFLVASGGRIADRSAMVQVDAHDDYQFATLSVDLMAKLCEILNGENATRFGSRARRGRFKPGDKVFVVDGDSPLFAFEAEVKRGVDSRGRLKAFIASLMGGATVDLTEAQVEPA